tara:strand:- start:7 stop:957 length:951 start_codon:yes stop_codon:yes gene_type:complete
MSKVVCTNCKKYKTLYKSFLNNDIYLINLIELSKFTNYKKKLKLLINKNWDKIIDSLKELDNIINELKKNINLKNTLIFDFIKRYNKLKKQLNNKKTFMNNLLLLIDTPNFLLEIKQLLYLLSSKKRCHLLVDTMKKQKINKKYVKDIVKSTKDNIDIMKQYLVTTKIKNYWGDPRCDYIREIYEMLKIINIYYKDPIKLYKIKVNYKKNKDYIEDILMKYVFMYKKDDFQNEKIDNIGTLLLFLRNKMTIWEAIDLIFNVIFNKCSLTHIEEAKLIGKNYIEFQKNNIKYAFKIYIMVKHKLISNINLFNNFHIT